MPTSDFGLSYDDNEIVISLRNIADRGRNLAQAHAAVGELAVGMVHERYALELGPGGIPLPKNSAYTKRQKRKLGRINKILQSTGIMKARTFYQLRGVGLIYGTSDRKARRHYQGIGVPVRDVWTPDPENVEEWTLTYRDFILSGVV